MHIFYQQAFETLFHRHDATKEMYKRERYTTFPIDEFRRVLGAFCLVTYLGQRFSFDEPSILHFLTEAFELEGQKVDSVTKENFLRGLLMSVCMLQKDGNEILFSHRSFQEYFCASYICSCDPTVVGKLLDEIVSRAFFDRTLSIIRDMSPEIFDRYWTMPRLSQIMTKVKSIDPAKNPKDYIKVFCDQLIILRQPRVIHFAPKGKVGRNWLLLNYIYGSSNWFSGDEYEKKMELVIKHLGHPPTDTPRMRYALEDLKPELIANLLTVEGKLDDKRKLSDLYDSLKERYARKDEQMNRLIAKARG